MNQSLRLNCLQFFHFSRTDLKTKLRKIIVRNYLTFSSSPSALHHAVTEELRQPRSIFANFTDLIRMFFRYIKEIKLISDAQCLIKLTIKLLLLFKFRLRHFF